MVVGPVLAVAMLVGVQRLWELRLAARNRAWTLAQGGYEVGRGHYPLFILLHLGWFGGWVLEAIWRGGPISSIWWLWLILFGSAQLLRYWAISSLGRHWNTRILVIPGAVRVRRGPYRFMQHPNYVAVAVELLSLPLIFNAWMTALAASLLNGLLLLGVRLPAEAAALQTLVQLSRDEE